MAILPVRDLGSTGVITDVAPYNLPAGAFSSGVNVRFDQGGLQRAPVFRTVKSSLGFSPRFAQGVQPPSGFDQVIMVDDDWTIYEYASGTVSDRSGSITGSSDPRPYTGTSLADVVYINREDRVPVYRDAASVNFQDLPNWNSNWRCRAMRSFGDFLLAVNVTEGATSYPSRIRWSNIVTANTYPDTWSETSLTASSGMNDLVQLETPILDAVSLGSNMMIFSSDQAWLMELIGGSLVFSFRKIHDDGIIATNCAVEVENKLYVFGPDTIYVTDGTTQVSIADNKVRDFIYQGLNMQNSDRFFVHYNEVLQEVMFCYQSGDALVGFPNSNRCNRAAVFSISNATWTFYDLPNVSAAAMANVNSVATFATVTGTFELFGGSFYSQESAYDRHSIFVGEDSTTDGITSDKIYGLDLADAGKLSFEIDTEATKPPFVERTGIDLDDAGSAVRQYVVVTRLFPQCDTKNTNDKTLTFQFGATDIPGNTPTYEAAVAFDTSTDYKIDSRAAGRYLAYKVTLGPTDYKSYDLTGYDIEVTATGGR